MLDAVGFHGDVYSDFADEAFTLLDGLATSLTNPDPDHNDEASLLTSFNDVGVASAITYHFRVQFEHPFALQCFSADLI